MRSIRPWEPATSSFSAANVFSLEPLPARLAVAVRGEVCGVGAGSRGSARVGTVRQLATDEYAELLATNLDDTVKALTQVRGLRDGWEQTARENESEIVKLMGQVRQGDNNLQRVEAERDEAAGAVA